MRRTLTDEQAARQRLKQFDNVAELRRWLKAHHRDIEAYRVFRTIEDDNKVWARYVPRPGLEATR